MVQGRLDDAQSTYEHALALVPEQSWALVRGTADMHAGMSEVCRERNDLEGARRHLLESQDLGAHAATAFVSLAGGHGTAASGRRRCRGSALSA
jgi:LuxR family maltose regulon positive regulatory protein